MESIQKKQDDRMCVLEEFYAKQPNVLEFRDFTLTIEKDVFPPDLGFSTYNLSKSIERYSGLTNALDMGCGTGVLALTLKRSGAKNVWAVDIHEPAVECTKINVSLYPELQPIHVLKSDLFKELDPAVKFDFIVFNQPYYPTKDNSVFGANSLGGKTIINLFFNEVKRFLSSNGIILMPYSNIAGEEHNPQKIAHKNGYASKIIDEFTKDNYTHCVYEFSR